MYHIYTYVCLFFTNYNAMQTIYYDVYIIISICVILHYYDMCTYLGFTIKNNKTNLLRLLGVKKMKVKKSRFTCSRFTTQ